MIEGDEVEAVAIVALAGMDAIAFLRSDDPLEQATIMSAAQHVLEVRAIERENAAVLIANKVGEMLGG